MNKVYTNHWIELPKEIREHLRKVFSIPRSGISEVRDQTLISDGTTNADLEAALTESAMSNYVGSKETFPRLWEITISKAKYEVNPPINIPVIELVLAPEPIIDPARLLPSPETKFCDSCDSKGIVHKAICPKLTVNMKKEVTDGQG